MLKRAWSKFTPGLALGVAVVAAPAPARAESVLQDADFADTPVLGARPHSPWRVSVSGGGNVKVATLGGGVHGALLTNPGGGHTGYEALRQTLTGVHPGDLLRVSGKIATIGGAYNYAFVTYGLKSHLQETQSDNVHKDFAQTFVARSSPVVFSILVEPGTVITFNSGFHTYGKYPLDMQVSGLAVIDLSVPEVDPRYGVLPAALAAGLLMLLGSTRRASKPGT